MSLAVVETGERVLIKLSLSRLSQSILSYHYLFASALLLCASGFRPPPSSPTTKWDTFLGRKQDTRTIMRSCLAYPPTNALVAASCFRALNRTSSPSSRPVQRTRAKMYAQMDDNELREPNGARRETIMNLFLLNFVHS